jgi:hypothetical protein
MVLQAVLPAGGLHHAADSSTRAAAGPGGFVSGAVRVNTATKGRRAEHRARAILEAAGFSVTQAAGSKGPADKKHAIVLALQTWPDKSQKSIAEQIGVSQQWFSDVARAVRSQDTGTGNLQDRVTGKDGKSYPASRSSDENDRGTHSATEGGQPRGSTWVRSGSKSVARFDRRVGNGSG